MATTARSVFHIVFLNLAAAAFFLASSSALAQTPQIQLTPEQQQQLIEGFLRRLQQPVQGGRGVPSQPAAATQAVSEETLKSKFAAWPALPAGVRFERHRDGFSVNGKRYIDSEGTIVSYGFDTLTGDATYLAQVDNTNFILKTTRV